MRGHVRRRGKNLWAVLISAAALPRGGAARHRDVDPGGLHLALADTAPARSPAP